MSRPPWLDGDALVRFAQTPSWLAPPPLLPTADLHQALSPDGLARAFARVRRSPAPGVDGVHADQFARRLGPRLRALSRDLRSGRYSPAPVLRLSRPKAGGGERVLGIPTIADRVAQRAVFDAVEPRVEALLHPAVHGWRRGRSPATAIGALLGAGTHPWLEVTKADVSALFDTLPHAGLLDCAGHAWPDALWRHLVHTWLRAWPTSPGRGVPQGAPLSPVLANLFLDRHLDRHVGARALAWVRYGDDVLATLDRPGGGLEWLSWLDGLVRHAGLSLSPAKVGWAPAGRGPVCFSALGHRLAIAPVATPAGAGWRLIRGALSGILEPGVLERGGTR